MNAYKRKGFNFPLLGFTVCAGILWWAAGEFFFSWARDYWCALGVLQNAVIAGLYAAMLTLCTLGARVLSEYLTPSLVNRDFFKMAVMTPQLKYILGMVFIMVFVFAGIAQFIYEYDAAVENKPVVTQTARRQVAQTPAKQGYDDYYYVVDNSSSMLETDPRNERIRLLSGIINNLSEQKRVALISFGEYAKTLVPIQPATADVKTTFTSFVNNPELFYSTDIMYALDYTSKALSKDTSRKGVVIFISDGQSEEYNFETTMASFTARNIPIYTVMLANPSSNYDLSEGVALLRKIADATGGKQSTVDNFEDLEQIVVESMNVPDVSQRTSIVVSRKTEVKPESKRSLLSKREGASEKSMLYVLLHIVFIALIGLLMGYSAYEVFSHKRLLKPMLAGGGLSGIAAGLVLELGLQNALAPAFIRFSACVILSVVFWALLHLFIERMASGAAAASTALADCAEEHDGAGVYAEFVLKDDSKRDSVRGVFEAQPEETDKDFSRESQ
ncbi:MAG: VWA domain-containing protein [Treponema sp.]|jgi:Mg-chelatase subunit ChlD|nr:VWA domain-containing protein [Treponema sp.]